MKSCCVEISVLVFLCFLFPSFSLLVLSLFFFSFLGLSLSAASLLFRFFSSVLLFFSEAGLSPVVVVLVAEGGAVTFLRSLRTVSFALVRSVISRVASSNSACSTALKSETAEGSMLVTLLSASLTVSAIPVSVSFSAVIVVAEEAARTEGLEALEGGNLEV